MAQSGGADIVQRPFVTTFAHLSTGYKSRGRRSGKLRDREPKENAQNRSVVFAGGGPLILCLRSTRFAQRFRSPIHLFVDATVGRWPFVGQSAAEPR
uniref:Uncharacterized protein n=1 Tax=Steinernema glaseri TaxID=37863 RepID=A0A1I7ZAT1_9BILA